LEEVRDGHGKCNVEFSNKVTAINIIFFVAGRNLETRMTF